jgi:hypothetical protein
VPHFQQLHQFDLFTSFHATERYEVFVKFPQEMKIKENEVRKIKKMYLDKISSVLLVGVRLSIPVQLFVCFNL